MDQYLDFGSAATDTRPRTGVESATTTDICDGSKTHGNEGQDMATLVAGRRTHGAKNNRVFPGATIERGPLAGQPPHDEDQHDEDHEHQRHPGSRHTATHALSSSSCR